MKKREALSLALNLGWTMLFSLLIPLLIGLWLDKRLNTSPLFVLIGAVLGVLAATVGVARMTLRIFARAIASSPEEQAQPNEEEPE
ncbi:MAG: AtpZ/AtpI family protein [Anaerolineae bacterium]